MRVGHAIGITFVTLTVAGAAVAWAPATSAQQQTGGPQSSSG